MNEVYKYSKMERIYTKNWEDVEGREPIKLSSKLAADLLIGSSLVKHREEVFEGEVIVESD